MNPSAENIVLLAKQHQIEELERLVSTGDFVEVVGNLIHSLQAERGASSLYIASSGKRFSNARKDIIQESTLLEERLRELFAVLLKNATYANAKMLSLMAWVLLGLDDIGLLRQKIDGLKLAATEAITAYSRLIAGLISLIFEVADTAIDPRISVQLVALFNLVQGKELAGQERALGSYSFGSGVIGKEHQQRVIHLIDSQDRHFDIFCELADKRLLTKWHPIQDSPAVAQLERLRRLLTSKNALQSLDSNLSEGWFESSSTRLTDIWELQCALVDLIQETSAHLISEAKADLQDVEGLLKHLRENPPARADMSDRFFDPSIPVELALGFVAPVGNEHNSGKTIIDLLQTQSRKLVDMEMELVAAKKSLAERKTIERAKGLLMTRFNISEDDAYKKMRSTAMEKKLRLADVAGTIISLAD